MTSVQLLFLALLAAYIFQHFIFILVTCVLFLVWQIVATFTQRSETSPVKTGYSFDSAGANVRSFPRLDTSERDSPSSSSSRTIRTTTTTTTSGVGGRVGEEDMFHQRVRGVRGGVRGGVYGEGGGRGGGHVPPVGEEGMFHQRGGGYVPPEGRRVCSTGG